MTKDTLSSLDDDIVKIIRLLDTCKSHAYNDISRGMLKICDLPIIKPLNHLINTLSCTNQSKFPDILKKSNIYPIHKKGDKEVISNYKPL